MASSPDPLFTQKHDSDIQGNLENQFAEEAGCGLANPSMVPVTFDLHNFSCDAISRTPSYDGQDPSPATDPADVLLAVQMEKLRVEEALAARDNVVAHLEDAYISVRQKVATILRLEQELEVFKRASTPANTNSFESDPKPPGSPQSDPSQMFEELEETQAGAVVDPVIQILLKEGNN